MPQLHYPLDSQVDFEPTVGERITGRDSHIQVVAGTAGTWLLRLRVLAERIEPGTQILWERYNIQLAHSFQTADPQRRDYLTAERTGNAPIEIDHVGEKTITLTIRGTPLLKGDEVIVRIGDRRDGSVGSEVFWTATRGRFTLTLVDGDQRRPAAPDVIVDNVHHHRPACIRVLGPTVAVPGEHFHVNLVIFDRNRNVVEDFLGSVELDYPHGSTGLPGVVYFGPADRGAKVFSHVTVCAPGVYRIRARLTGEELVGISNPIVCLQEPDVHTYWGDLHAHGWGDSTMLLMHDRTEKMEPSDRHRQGRLYGRFDYGAPGAMSMTADAVEREETWQAYLDAFDEHDEPGRYVPFMQMEMHPGADGDRTLIFREKTGIPIDMREPSWRVYEQYGNRDDAMLEVHIGGAPPYYDSFRPANEQLVEVCSGFANAEWLMQKCLREGFRFAITGASDLHVGLMGAPRAVETFRGRFGSNMGLNVRDSGHGSGPVGAIMAPELTREALWASLRNRHTYATSGDRIFVSLDAGGFTMGDVADLPDRFGIDLTVHGQDTLERIDLIVGKYLAASLSPNMMDAQWHVNFDRTTMPPGTWFYFRIKQVNNEWAWTAPVWFADGDEMGDAAREWPAWNHAQAPAPDHGPELERHLADLLAYLEREGDREHFGEITPVGIVTESVGTAARFISTSTRHGYPVTIRWFYEFEIPKLRVDWGHDFFGPVDCWRGPAG